MLNKGTKFFATWTPESINGEENFHGQSISRKGLWDEKSKIDINKKTGKRYMTFWDRDKKDIQRQTLTLFQLHLTFFRKGQMKDNYWQKLVNKHLVGRKIVKVKWLDPKETDRLFGWSQQPCEIHLDNGTVLTPSMDDEGNDAGAIFTNITELSVIPTFRE